MTADDIEALHRYREEKRAGTLVSHEELTDDDDSALSEEKAALRGSSATTSVTRFGQFSTVFDGNNNAIEQAS